MGPTQDKSTLSTQTDDSDGPDIPSVETPSPPSSPSTLSPTSGRQGLRLFHWSASSFSTEQSRTPNLSSGLAALQKFQFKRETIPSSPKNHRPSGHLSQPELSSPDKTPVDKDDIPDSPPSQDSAYFSQPQPCFTSFHKEEAPTYSFPSSNQDSAASVRRHKLRNTSSSQFHVS